MPLGDWYPLAFYGPGAAAARLAGTGGVAPAGVSQAAAAGSLSGTGVLSDADLTAGWVIRAHPAGTGSMVSGPLARGRLGSLVSIGARPSAADIAQAVWGAPTTINTEPGTMAVAMGDAGSAGNPWSTVIEGAYTAEQMLRLIAASLAGQLSGAGTTTITIKGIDGTTDRIVATVSGGNRTAVALDGD